MAGPTSAAADNNSNGATEGTLKRPHRDSSSYSNLQRERITYKCALPKVLQAPVKLESGPATTAADSADTIAKLFPLLYGQPSVTLVPDGVSDAKKAPVKVGVVLSGGQAPGGHNVIAGIYDFLEEHAPGSTVYGFWGGPAGIMKCKYVVITGDYLEPFRNQGGFDIICSGRDKIETPEQFAQAVDTVQKLELNGLVVIGGDDSNTNACLLAEHFKAKDVKTHVIGCPKTIDGDLKTPEVPISFGFDTACKTYSELIGNVAIDAKSAGKYYHFIRLMGRAASHITLECAFQTHPNIAIIGEEVYSKHQTLRQVTSYIADVVCKRAEQGKNFGIVLIPEGLIDFIPEVHHLLAELNDVLANRTHEDLEEDKEGHWKKELSHAMRVLYESLPSGIQEELLLDRDPHGNVQVAKIETEKMLISMVEAELLQRHREEAFSGKFNAQGHFFGYEGRCALPTNFDSIYCYTIGHVAAALLSLGQTGLIASVTNICDTPENWKVGGTALTSLMNVEHRKGKDKPVIKKAMVELDGVPFKKFCAVRDQWAFDDSYRNPGPIQFWGPSAADTTLTLQYELGYLN